jgi:superfamily II DNA/RNA helicase
LILVPTRELVDQIYKVAKLLAYNTGIKIARLYGGVSHDTQSRDLKSGVDIVISTTGRLLDFLNNNAINLSNVQHLIIDEADRLLEMGFEKQLNEILFQHSK